MRFKLCYVILTSVFALAPSFTQARELPEILRDGMMNNPKILEAQANKAVSQSRLDQSRAARYPVVSATASQPMISTDDRRRSFTPGLTAKWTLYDFGKISAQVEADEIEAIYRTFKVDETTEKWAYEFANYYLSGVAAKLQLSAAQDNLALHEHIVEQMRIINQYDPGRRSELTQAESRLVSVQESIVNYQRNLDLNIRRMGRYVQPGVNVSELADPFYRLSATELVNKYPMSNEWLQQNASYLAQEQELLKNQANLKIAERARYPSIDVQAQANKDDTMVYLTMAVDLFDRKKSPAIQEQQYLIEAAKAKMNQMENSLKEQAELALIEVQRADAQLEIIDRQIVALQQVVVDYEDQFKIAKRTLLNVVDAYSELSNAQQGRVTTKYALMKAKLDYLSAVGGLTKWAQAGLDMNMRQEENIAAIWEYENNSEREIEQIEMVIFPQTNESADSIYADKIAKESDIKEQLFFSQKSSEAGFFSQSVIEENKVVEIETKEAEIEKGNLAQREVEVSDDINLKMAAHEAKYKAHFIYATSDHGFFSQHGVSTVFDRKAAPSEESFIQVDVNDVIRIVPVSEGD